MASYLSECASFYFPLHFTNNDFTPYYSSRGHSAVHLKSRGVHVGEIRGEHGWLWCLSSDSLQVIITLMPHFPYLSNHLTERFPSFSHFLQSLEDPPSLLGVGGLSDRIGDSHFSVLGWQSSRTELLTTFSVRDRLIEFWNDTQKHFRMTKTKVSRFPQSDPFDLMLLPDGVLLVN